MNIMGELTNNDLVAAGVVGFLMSMVFFSLILFLIGGWRIFEKAGEKGWKIFIPIYSSYIFYKIVKMEKWFWILIITSMVVSVICSSLGFDTNNASNNNLEGNNLIAFIIYVVFGIFTLVVDIYYSIRTSKAFGHGVLFAIGLILFQPLFMMILGLGESKYDKKLVSSWAKK